MPLKFEEPENEKEDKPKRVIKKEAPPSSSSSSDKDKKKRGTHRRVFTQFVLFLKASFLQTNVL